MAHVQSIWMLHVHLKYTSFAVFLGLFCAQWTQFMYIHIDFSADSLSQSEEC